MEQVSGPKYSAWLFPYIIFNPITFRGKEWFPPCDRQGNNLGKTQHPSRRSACVRDTGPHSWARVHTPTHNGIWRQKKEQHMMLVTSLQESHVVPCPSATIYELSSVLSIGNHKITRLAVALDSHTHCILTIAVSSRTVIIFHFTDEKTKVHRR